MENDKNILLDKMTEDMDYETKALFLLDLAKIEENDGPTAEEYELLENLDLGENEGGLEGENIIDNLSENEPNLGGLEVENIIENGSIADPIEEQQLGERRNFGIYYDYKTSPVVDVIKEKYGYLFVYCPFCFAVGKKFYPIGKKTQKNTDYKHGKRVIHRLRSETPYFAGDYDNEINQEDGTFNADLWKCKNYRWEDLGRFGGKIKLDLSNLGAGWEDDEVLDTSNAVFCGN